MHAAPVYMNKQANIKKVVGLIKQAGQEGIKLLVFPETFVPGYPVSPRNLPTQDTPNNKLFHSIS